MQFTMTTTNGLERRIEVAIPHTRVAGEVERRLRDLSRTASIKGFRPGKVPFAVIKQQYGAQAHGDTVSELIRESYSEALTKENLRPAGGPRIEPIAVEPGSDLKFAAVFEVLPEVSIKPVEELTVERPLTEVTEADIDAMLESMRRQRVTYTPVERASQKGDRVVADFLGRVDGVAFAGGEGKDTAFVLGSGRAIADFEAALTGMSAGESKTAPVKFPDAYSSPDLAGKQAEFDLTVKSVEAEVLPPIDDALASAFGLQEGGVASLRTEVRQSMEREVAEAVRNRLRAQVFDALAKDNPLELPRALVDEQVQELQVDMMRRMGAKDASQAPPREPFEEPARRRVALGLLIGELVRRENMKVDRERVHARLNELATAYPNADEVRRAYLQSQDAMRQIETSVLEDQTVDWVVQRARVTDRPISFAELTGFGKQA
ncbi:MAG TPA: trigger factor [Steroidobacteraceae bacterium]|nr:trigger factor [Steroidobacteraceae bacterium]